MQKNICPLCGREQKPEARFCASCGAALPEPKPYCASCGAELKPGAKFCPACGSSVDAPPPTPEQQPVPEQQPAPEQPALKYSPEEEYLPDEPKKSTWWIWLICGVVLIGLAAVTIRFIIPAITGINSPGITQTVDDDEDKDREDNASPAPEQTPQAPATSPTAAPVQELTVTQAELIRTLTRYYFLLPMAAHNSGNIAPGLTSISEFLHSSGNTQYFVWTYIDSAIYAKVEEYGYDDSTDRQIMKELFGEGCIMVAEGEWDLGNNFLIPQEAVVAFIERKAGAAVAASLDKSIFTDGYFHYFVGDPPSYTVTFEYEGAGAIVTGREYPFDVTFCYDGEDTGSEMEIYITVEADAKTETGYAITGFRITDLEWEQITENWLSVMVQEGAWRYYSRSELYLLSQFELSVLRNGMYALSGKKFSRNQEIIDFFNDCDWYYGLYTDDDVVQSYMNDYQKANLDLIISVEREFGYRN